MNNSRRDDDHLHHDAASSAQGLGSVTDARLNDEVVLASVGMVFDGGLCADECPPNEWVDYAAHALDVHSITLATCTQEQWDGEEAAEIIDVAAALRALLQEIAERGAVVFHALSDEDRRHLRTSAQLIRHVTKQFQ